MPSHVARACASRSMMSSPVSPSTSAHTAARSACSCSRARRWRSASARAASSAASRSRTTVGRRLEIRFDVRLDVGIGEQLDPCHATRPRRPRAAAPMSRHRRERLHLRDEVARVLLVAVLVDRRRSRRRAAGAAARISVRAFFCAALVRAFSAMAVSVSLMGSAGDRPRPRRRRRARRASPRLRFRRHRSGARAPPAARRPRRHGGRCCPGISHRAPRQWPRAALHPGPATFASLRQLAVAAKRRPAPPRPSSPSQRSCFDACSTSCASAWSRTLPSDSFRTMSASTDASPMRATAARRTRASVIVLGKCVERRLMSAGSSLVNGFDANVGVGMRGFGLRAKLVEDSHGSFRPRRPQIGPAEPSFWTM